MLHTVVDRLLASGDVEQAIAAVLESGMTRLPDGSGFFTGTVKSPHDVRGKRGRITAEAKDEGDEWDRLVGDKRRYRRWRRTRWCECSNGACPAHPGKELHDIQARSHTVIKTETGEPHRFCGNCARHAVKSGRFHVSEAIDEGDVVSFSAGQRRRQMALRPQRPAPKRSMKDQFLARMGFPKRPISLDAARERRDDPVRAQYDLAGDIQHWGERHRYDKDPEWRGPAVVSWRAQKAAGKVFGAAGIEGVKLRSAMLRSKLNTFRGR